MTGFKTITIENDKDFSKIVYFLFDENEKVVYVGMSLNGLSRPLSHRDKDYKKVVIHDLSNFTDAEVLTKEETMIVKYKPKYNKLLNNGNHLSLHSVKNRLKRLGVSSDGHHKSNLKRKMRELNIEAIHLNNMVYYQIDDCMSLIEMVLNDEGRTLNIVQ